VNARVDRSVCVGHAQCTAICPSVFSSDESGYAVVIGDGSIAPTDEPDARLAADSCPEQAITITT
jgi:ferredoxin